jgi:hypothetical protein
MKYVTKFCFLALGLTSGCVSSKYRSASPKTPPAQPLNLSAELPAATAVLNHVIIYQGPGSWKDAAHWDEYVVAVVNRGSTPLTLDGTTLMGLASKIVQPGVDPWAVEKSSQAEEKRRFGLPDGVGFQLGRGSVIAATAATGVGLFSAAAGATAAEIGAVAGATAGLVVVPIYAGVAIHRNSTHRQVIEHEFQTRRLVLPLTLAPGRSAQGSLFFHVTPGPRRLTLRIASAGQVEDLVIDLSPLGGLHLNSEPAAVSH